MIIKQSTTPLPYHIDAGDIVCNDAVIMFRQDLKIASRIWISIKRTDEANQRLSASNKFSNIITKSQYFAFHKKVQEVLCPYLCHLDNTPGYGLWIYLIEDVLTLNDVRNTIANHAMEIAETIQPK